MKEWKIALMEERRLKVARQAENKQKWKEDLDTNFQEYGGLWKASNEMKKKLDQIPALK